MSAQSATLPPAGTNMQATVAQQNFAIGTKRRREVDDTPEAEEGEISETGHQDGHGDVSMTDRSRASPTPPPPNLLQNNAPSQGGWTPPAPANPHLQSSRAGPTPTLPTESRVAYTSAIYPRVVKSLDALLSELKDSLKETIRNDPDKYIALLIYGGGYRIKEENPNLMKDIETFLQGIVIAGNETVRVIDPPKRDVEKRGEFSKPHILLLHSGSPRLREFILWHQTFAFQIEDRKIAFSALRFDAEVRPWFITDLTGDIVEDDERLMKAALETIKGVLGELTRFRNHVDGCMARAEKKPRPIDDRVRDALKTFEIHAMKVTDKTGKERVVWQLFAKPVAIDGPDYLNWTDIIKGQRYVIDDVDEIFAVKQKPDKPYDSCAFCKDDTHSDDKCPFPLVADWKGPIPKEVRAAREKAKMQGGDSARGGQAMRGRNNERGRGGRLEGRRAKGTYPGSYRRRPY